MTIREENAADVPAIHEVECAAFGRKNEADLVDTLRCNGKLILSLVAETESGIAGHIAFSGMALDPPSADDCVLGLGPVAVLPDRQGKGVGSSLVREGLRIAHSLGYTHIVLLGAPAYYRRFGFVPARRFGISNEYTSGDEFMIVALSGGNMPRGVMMNYQPEFAAV